jgi:hypothetical protein
MTKLRVAAALTSLGLLAACSSGGDDLTKTSQSSTPTRSASSGTPTTAQVTSESPASGGLAAALLTAAEVGTGYRLGTDQTDGNSALPCTPSAPPLFTQAPPKDKANHNFQNTGDTVEISEVVASYADDTGATKAFTTGSAGFTCSSGTIGGQKVTIVKRTDGAPAGSSLDGLRAWDFATTELKGTAILVRAGSKLIGLTFVASPTAAAGVPVGDITERAATKVLQAG